MPYGRGAIAFHWITAVLIVIVGILGLLHDSWPRSTQAFWIDVHALIGLTLWMLVMARLIGAVATGRPIYLRMWARSRGGCLTQCTCCSMHFF